MSRNDRELGMGAKITRRDFMDGVALTVGAAMVSPLGLAQSAPAVHVTPPSADYPPSLTGMRGQNQAALSAAHMLRDGGSFDTAADTGEVYDLVIAGAGMSGLSAAYFYRRALPEAKILILDNHDDFGGHARRNEMVINGKPILMNGGTMEIQDLDSYTPDGKLLLEDIGVRPARFFEAAKGDRRQYARMGLSNGCFFDQETFGVDRLVKGFPGFAGFGSSAEPLPMAEFLRQTPLSKSVQSSLLKMTDDRTDYFPGLTREQKIDRLRTMSYQSFLLDVMKLDPDIIKFIYRLDTHSVNGAAGPDSYSAWAAFRRAYGPSAFDGLNLGERPKGGWTPDQILIHFPDGNGTLARLLIRSLIPGALPGTTMEDSITARMNYAVLDEPRNKVRVRLKSTVVAARHNGDPAVAKDVSITYVRDGKAFRVKAANTVMACFNAMVPYICPELGQKQKDALHMSVRMPIVYTNVALRNWKAHEKLGVSNIYYPGGFHSQISMDNGARLGAYRRSPTPNDPIFVNLWKTPMEPNTGLNARDQFRVGRAKLLAISFEDFEYAVRDQLTRALGPGGFDPQRDILGIFVNRWGHGYAGCANDLYDPEWPREEVPWVVGRKRFGRIAIANSDAGATCLTQAAFDQGHRAVMEIIGDNVRPSFGYPWGERT